MLIKYRSGENQVLLKDKILSLKSHRTMIFIDVALACLIQSDMVVCVSCERGWLLDRRQMDMIRVLLWYGRKKSIKIAVLNRFQISYIQGCRKSCSPIAVPKLDSRFFAVCVLQLEVYIRYNGLVRLRFVVSEVANLVSVMEIKWNLPLHSIRANFLSFKLLLILCILWVVMLRQGNHRQFSLE